MLPAVRDQVLRLQDTMLGLPDAQVDLDALTTHTFAPGVYVRTLHIPAGVVAVGKEHATEHVFILSRGTLLLTGDDGETREVRAPFQCVTKPGAKRAVLAVTDCDVTNVHINADDERDLLRLEARYVVPEALPAPAVRERIEEAA